MTMNKILVSTLLCSSLLQAGFDFGECSGSETFGQEIEHYGLDQENAVTVGTIPKGIQGLRVELISDKDVDIRLYGQNNDKVVHWPAGILSKASEETKPYKHIDITYSGYNGDGTGRGHEFIEVEGVTPTDMTMKAFGYQSGYATVNYSWTGKEGCEAGNGSGHFKQDIPNKATTLVGTIPANIENLEVKLTSDKDIDIQLYGEDGTAIVKWPDGLLKGGNKQNIEYHGMQIEWSGYNGDGTGRGHEYIKIKGKTTEMLTMKVYGYQAGVADVDYTWGSAAVTEIALKDWVRTNPGAGGTINMIGATASGILVTASDLSGVYVSLDKKGTHWEALGEKNGLMLTAHMSALGFHPTDGNTFYVGTGRGVYKTTDAGQTFDLISQNIPDNSDNNTYVQSIVASNNVMYVTYHKWDDDSPSKIARSTNEGETWTDVSFPSALTPSNLRIVKLLVHPQNKNLLYAISGKPRWGCSAANAYRSTNGGQSWVHIEHDYDVLDLDIDFSNENILYMSTFKVTSCEDDAEVLTDDEGQAINGNLYKSFNKGNTFQSPALLNQTGIISVGTGHVNDASTIRLVNILTFSSAYWVGDNESGTWESTDSGVSWKHIGTVSQWRDDIGYSNNPYTAYGQAFNGWNKTLTKDIFNSDRLYGAGAWTLATFDGGASFESLSTKKKSNDTWLSTGLENINGFALDVNDKNENVIYIGGYDIGFWVSKDKGLSWKWQYPFKNDLLTLNNYTWGATDKEPNADEPQSLKVIGGSNVMTLLSDPERPNVVWSSFARSQNFDEAEIDTGNPEKNDRSSLFRSTNYGDTWELAPIYNTNGTLLNAHVHHIIYGLSIDKSSANGTRVLYVTVNGHVAKSVDDGRNWQIIREDGGLKFTAVSAGVLYAGGKNGLWRLKNNAWTRMGGNLANAFKGVGSPMIADIGDQSNSTHYDDNWDEIIDAYAWNGVHDIKIDPTNDEIVYVVVYGGPDQDENEKGLYKTVNGGSTWTKIDLGDFESRYLRYITIDPTDHNTLFVTSSENINSGGAGGSSKGIFYSSNGGISWKDANKNMAWKFGSAIEIDTLGKRVWAWSPGTGIQYMDIRL